MSLAGWILLLLVVAAAGYYLFRQRRAAPRPGTRSDARTRAPSSDDDLTSLGLSNVRVAATRAASGAAPEPSRSGSRPRDTPMRPARESALRDDRAEPRPVAPRPSGPPASEARPVASARPAPPAQVRPGTGLWDEDDRAVPHLLASLAASVGGTAAVLRHEGDVYHVEALAGDRTRLPAPIAADDCPLHRAAQEHVLTRLPDDLGGLATLGDEPRVYARALAGPPGERVFLVVGTPDADGDAEVLARIERYADLLASLTDLGGEPAEAPSEEAPAVPRATIIREEQEAARSADRPLAFALVTLAHAEEVLEAEGPGLARAEAALHARLAGAPNVERVEPFGDLLVGAFLHLAPEAMAEWCTELSASDPPLFIGAVAPAEGEPDAIRDAAAAALHDAYDKRRAQIVSA